MAVLRVSGAREVMVAFREADAGLPTVMRKDMLAIAEMVVSTARQNMPIISGDARASVQPKASKAWSRMGVSASVAFGGSKAPYVPWLDFGGSVGRGHRPRVPGSGSVKRPIIIGGRYVYPAIDSRQDDIEKVLAEAVLRSAAHAGLGTR